MLDFLDLSQTATKFGSFMAVCIGGPSYLLGMVTSEWGALVTGTSVGVIGAGFAIVGLLRDKQIASLRATVDGLAEEAESRRKRWMDAEKRFDELETLLARTQKELDKARKATCPICDYKLIPERDSDVFKPRESTP